MIVSFIRLGDKTFGDPGQSGQQIATPTNATEAAETIHLILNLNMTDEVARFDAIHSLIHNMKRDKILPLRTV